ncbi:MAG: alcohol dehydrogenase catalytic domain-containing protein [Armatimonadota bacterium]
MITSNNIPSSMKAVVLEKPNTLTYREIPVWPVESYGDPDLVLVEVDSCGVCGSDFRYYAGENPWAQHTLGRHMDNPPNIVLGHEFAGKVVAVVDEKNAHLLGKRVSPVCSKTCGECSDCKAGRHELCAKTVHMGHGQGWGVQPFYPGAYAQYVPSWGANCYEIPENISFEEASMMDILAVCVHVAKNGNIAPGRPVLIMGAGPAGNGIAQAAKAMGASEVVITDRMDTALNMAKSTGIDHVVDVREKSQEELQKELAGFAPEGYGSVFDSIGTKDSFALGVKLLGKAATLVNMAVHDEEFPVNFMSLGSERKITTSCNFAVEDFPLALSWLASGKFKVKHWLTEIKLCDVPKVFAEISKSQGERDAFKLVIRNQK